MLKTNLQLMANMNDSYPQLLANDKLKADLFS